MITIAIGYDRQHLAIFSVADATSEEIDVLENTDSPEALALAKKLDAAGRLTFVFETSYAECDYFNEPTSAVIECLS